MNEKFNISLYDFASSSFFLLIIENYYLVNLKGRFKNRLEISRSINISFFKEYKTIYVF
jgi:hypothetical protein